MSISIPGAVFSSLMFHLKNSPSDSEGFLYGSVRSHQVESITDSQSSGTREEKKLYVESFVCFSERFKFYDHYGRPHTDRISTLLGDEAKRVVGWFSYRRNTTHQPSMREKVVHRRLTNCFTNVTNRDFLFGLVTEQVVDGSTVHSTDYSFYNWIGTSLKLVKVGIVNLQVTATVPYQLLPIIPTTTSLPHYSSTLQQHRSKFMDSQGCMIQALMSEQLYKAILVKLKPMCDSLSEASVAVENEAKEVEELERQLLELTIQAAAEKEEETNSQDSGLTFASTTIPMTSSTHENTREHIEVAPLINFNSETAVTSSSQHKETIIDLTASEHSPSDHSLLNGETPIINLLNDSNIRPSTSSYQGTSSHKNGGCGMEVDGIVGSGDQESDDATTAAESVSGSQQELF